MAYLVEPLLAQHPLSGHLFVFIGRDRHKVKILYLDRNCFALWYNGSNVGRLRHLVSHCWPGTGSPGGRVSHGGVDVPWHRVPATITRVPWRTRTAAKPDQSGVSLRWRDAAAVQGVALARFTSSVGPQSGARPALEDSSWLRNPEPERQKTKNLGARPHSPT